jgi:hypothetical protein
MTMWEKEGKKSDTRAMEGEKADEVAEEEKEEEKVLGSVITKEKEKIGEEMSGQKVIPYEELKETEKDKPSFKKEGNKGEQKQILP